MSQLEVDKIIPQSGTTLTIGDSGDTITIPSGATQSITGTLSGAGAIDLSSATITLNDVMKNTPAFEAYLGSPQSISDDVITKVQFNTELFDTDGCYDNTTNYRFTPTTAGKYFVYSQVRFDTDTNSDLEYGLCQIAKNNIALKQSLIDLRSNYGRQASIICQSIIDMNGTTDYLEIKVQVNAVDGNNVTLESVLQGNSFGAYKLIGA